MFLKRTIPLISFLFLIFFVQAYPNGGSCRLLTTQETGEIVYSGNFSRYVIIGADDNFNNMAITLGGVPSSDRCVSEVGNSTKCGLKNISVVNNSNISNLNALFDGDYITAVTSANDNSQWREINITHDFDTNISQAGFGMLFNGFTTRYVRGDIPSACFPDPVINFRFITDSSNSTGYREAVNISCVNSTGQLDTIFWCRDTLSLGGINLYGYFLNITPVTSYPSNISIKIGDSVYYNFSGYLQGSLSITDIGEVFYNISQSCSCSSCVSAFNSCIIPVLIDYSGIGILTYNFTEDFLTFSGGSFFNTDGVSLFSIAISDFIIGSGSFSSVLFAYNPTIYTEISEHWNLLVKTDNFKYFFKELGTLSFLFLKYILREPAALIPT